MKKKKEKKKDGSQDVSHAAQQRNPLQNPLMWPHEDQDIVASGENQGWTKKDAQRSRVVIKS